MLAARTTEVTSQCRAAHDPGGQTLSGVHHQQGEETGVNQTLEKKKARTARFTSAEALYMHHR